MTGGGVLVDPFGRPCIVQPSTPPPLPADPSSPIIVVPPQLNAPAPFNDPGDIADGRERMRRSPGFTTGSAGPFTTGPLGPSTTTPRVPRFRPRHFEAQPPSVVIVPLPDRR
jgi:hypothetical protein